MAESWRDPGRERFWREVVARCRASGLSIRAFCRREKLGEPLFYAWRRTIAERDAEKPTSNNRLACRSRPQRVRPAAARSARRRGTPAPAGRPAFLPVVMPHEPLGSAAAGVMVELRGGRVLRF